MAEKEVVVRSDPAAVDAVNRVNAGISELKEAIREGTERTVAEVRRVAESAAETELAKQRAEIEAIEPLIQRQGQNIALLDKRVHQRMQAIKARFDKAEEQLRFSYRRDLRRLGAHIFDILENEYQRGIENRIHGADFEVFTRVTGKVYQDRASILRTWLDKAKQSAQGFLGKRQQFKATLKDAKLDARVDGDAQFAVPAWVVEVEEEDGTTSLHLLGLCKLVTRATGDYRYELVEMEGYEQVSDLLRDHMAEVAQRLTWRESAGEERQAIADALLRLSPGTVSGELKRLVQRALKEHPLSVAKE